MRPLTIGYLGQIARSAEQLGFTDAEGTSTSGETGASTQQLPAIRLSLDGDHWSIEDLGSRNGTFVNGKPVRAPVPLHDGDEITVGDVSMRFRADAQSRVELTTSTPNFGGSGTYVIKKEDLNFQRFAEESGSGEEHTDSPRER